MLGAGVKAKGCTRKGFCKKVNVGMKLIGAYKSVRKGAQIKHRQGEGRKEFACPLKE